MAPTPKPTCGICCEPLNKSTRKPVTCGCEYTACAACTRRYLLESPNEPDCMSCHRRWTIPVLCEKLPRTFVTGPLREHTMDMLVDREKSRLPATQPYATLVKAVLRQNRHRTSYRRLTLLLSTRAAVDAPGGLLSVLENKDRDALVMEIGYAAELTEEELQRRLAPLGGDAAAGASSSAPPPKKYNYVRACPADGCRGFLSDKWCCALCDTRVCKKCHEIKAAGPDGAAPHRCDPAAVASAALIAKDSRPCPKCAALIHRIDGCAHMFCTACSTPFHWTTGEIMTSNSNPLYYEWQRTRAAAARAEAPDAPAPGAPACETPEATYEWLQDIARVYTRKVCDTLCCGEETPIAHLPMYMSHNRYAITSLRQRTLRWKGRNARPEDPHRPLRVSYMLGLYDEATFKKELQARERKLLAARDCAEVYEMFSAAMGDLALRAFRARGPEAIADLACELNELRDYANDALGQLSRAHGLKMEQINPTYSIPV